MIDCMVTIFEEKGLRLKSFVRVITWEKLVIRSLELGKI